MSKICHGCGIKLQSDSKKKEGYTPNLDNLLCERCFKIKNYGEQSIIDLEVDYKKILNKINKEDAVSAYLIDILNINKESLKVLDYLKEDSYILLTKRDLLPKSVKESKIIEYFKENYSDKFNVLLISSHKKQNIDAFMNLLNKNKVKKLYVLGLANAGKSTFINTIINSVNKISNIITSPIPNTTLDYIKIKVSDNLTIIDTPGFVPESSIYNHLDANEIRKLTPKKELKVKTIQIKENFCIIVDNILRIDYLSKDKNSFTFYMNDNLNYEKMKITTRDSLVSLPKKNIHLCGREDIVINGLGFIKVSKECDVVVYTLDENIVSVRKSMI